MAGLIVVHVRRHLNSLYTVHTLSWKLLLRLDNSFCAGKHIYTIYIQCLLELYLITCNTILQVLTIFCYYNRKIRKFPVFLQQNATIL